MQITPVGRPQGDATNNKTVQTFRTSRNLNPALRDKMAAANSAQPPPIPAPAMQPPAQQTNNEEIASAPAAATSPQSLSPHFAALARKERQFRKTQQDFEAAKAEWTKQQQDYIPRSSLQTDPLKVLTDAGISYDRLVELQLGQPAQDPNQELQKQVDELKAQLAGTKSEWKTAEEQRDLQAEQQALNVIKQDVELLVDADPAYETIKATETQGEVVDLIKAIFKQEGKMLSIEEAARLVEEELVERTAEQVKRYGELSKIKSKLNPAPVEELAPEQSMRQQPQVVRQAPPPQPKTLTNAQSVQRPLSARERAIQAFERARLK